MLPPPRLVIVLAGKLASKQRRDNYNTTLYLSPKSFDENNSMSQHDQEREAKQKPNLTLSSPFSFSRHASSPMLPLQSTPS